MPIISDSVSTPDGTCPVRLFTPAGPGPWPGVIMFPDAGGVRETFEQMAATLAGHGYVVLLPDVYYREGDWTPFAMETVFGDADERARLMFMLGTLTPDRVTRDAGAYFDYLATRPQVSGERFGVCGYCMGGRISVLLAGRQPDRVAAAASFHGGGLVTDNPDSPHLLADRMTARLYVGGATNDPSFTTDHAEQLEKALTAAGVEHTIEWYPGAHGFAVPDNPPYDEACAQRHWTAMTDLFAATLSR
ncbi:MULTISPECIES: alpha/beta fold hydrolase [Mycobacterium]|uniref:Dienelactone hydrolase domain-containing protein n=3 Tax=Mycobacterium ulcerans group TaxID=2993898 RepID=A0A9N7LRD0_9MYCO|nr:MULTISPECIES: alpha/beta fold hydrolase [Mycobacterium]EPQ48469.1 Dienelactone hydrolase family [Mycobacterium sp. 012931]MEB3971028.1 dienelactone hydrolase family protein [Mycobacterium ulcerans]MEB3979283.1 dienelactone hydrolase family protein [Mycobacterium ulcerans]MEB4008557.1 dienelactone hydrolase family protein [Mycobacterium ulcerans]MEB4418152.1 dienelactone hydrolase family protein [Mycobacterium ulcerans]